VYRLNAHSVTLFLFPSQVIYVFCVTDSLGSDPCDGDYASANCEAGLL